MDLLSLFPDGYLLQPSKFVLHPTPCRGKQGEHQFLSADCRGAVVWSDNLSILLPRRGRQIQGGRLYTPFPQMCWLMAPTCDGLQSLSGSLTVVYSSHICLAMVFLALGPDYYGERWGVGLWLGCVLWWAVTGAPGHV